MSAPSPAPSQRATATAPSTCARTGTVFHTYSTYGRGIDLTNTAYNYIDLTPAGRSEPAGPQHWVRRHDEYGD